MEATITQSNHTVMFADDQVDIFYFFGSNNMHVYINGVSIFVGMYNPSRLVLSYTNIIQVASLYYSHYCKHIKPKYNDTDNPPPP